MKPGINPVTIRGRQDWNMGKKLCMTFGRLHISPGENEPWQKKITGMVWEEKYGTAKDTESVQYIAVVEEEVFLSGLEHLFPAGEFHRNIYRDILQGLYEALEWRVTHSQSPNRIQQVAEVGLLKRAKELLDG